MVLSIDESLGIRMSGIVKKMLKKINKTNEGFD